MRSAVPNCNQDPPKIATKSSTKFPCPYKIDILFRQNLFYGTLNYEAASKEVGTRQLTSHQMVSQGFVQPIEITKKAHKPIVLSRSVIWWVLFLALRGHREKYRPSRNSTLYSQHDGMNTLHSSRYKQPSLTGNQHSARLHNPLAR